MPSNKHVEWDAGRHHFTNYSLPSKWFPSPWDPRNFKAAYTLEEPNSIFIVWNMNSNFFLGPRPPFSLFKKKIKKTYSKHIGREGKKPQIKAVSYYRLECSSEWKFRFDYMFSWPDYLDTDTKDVLKGIIPWKT